MKRYLGFLAITAMLLPAITQAGNMYLGPTVMIQNNQGSSSSFRGVSPRLMFGYSDVIEDIYLAGEVFIIGGTATLDDNYSGSALSAKTKQGFGAAFIPGFSINQTTMGFFRLGIITSKFSGPDVYASGAQWGVGLETVLTPYWDVRAEYNYTTYKTVNTLGAVKTDQIGLGLVYKVI